MKNSPGLADIYPKRSVWVDPRIESFESVLFFHSSSFNLEEESPVARALAASTRKFVRARGGRSLEDWTIRESLAHRKVVRLKVGGSRARCQGKYVRFEFNETFLGSAPNRGDPLRANDIAFVRDTSRVVRASSVARFDK